MDRVRIKRQYSQKKNLAGRWQEMYSECELSHCQILEICWCMEARQTSFQLSFGLLLVTLVFAQHHQKTIIRTAFAIIEKCAMVIFFLLMSLVIAQVF